LTADCSLDRGFVVKNFIFRRRALSVVAGLAISAAAAAQGPAPIFTKNTALRLPVQLDERARADVAEVKLYVRGPTGRWECAQTAAPTQTAFDYRALGDGEYWFTFVTVDRRGNATPGNLDACAPHRKVIVDSTPPDVSAQPIPINGGEKALQCQVRDAHPDWSTLRVVYQSADGTWQPLTVAAPDMPTVFRIPSPSVLESKIQVTVADRAGNRTTREIDLGDPTVPLGLPGKAALDRGRPDPALFPRDDRAEPAIPTKTTSDLPMAPKIDLPDLPALPDIPNIKGNVMPDIKLPPDVPGIKIPDPPAMKMPATRPPAKSGDDLYKIPDPPGAPMDMPLIKPPMDLPPPVVPATGTNSALKPSEMAIPDIVPPGYKKMESSAPKPATTGLPPILNTRTCTVNYQVDGPARLSTRIDFWATRDGGKTWVPVKDTAGGGPPARLMLPDDGVWGIRIRPGGGLRGPEPLEEPDCLVEVDTVKPAVTLAPPTVAIEEGTMVISWTASDKNLMGNSINLYYATKPEGPWEVIVSGYKNEGAYRWTLPTTLTGPVYLRAEASDRAGNTGRCDLPTPVALESGKQRVKVIGVGPGQ
jgi:hypothetical protein